MKFCFIITITVTDIESNALLVEIKNFYALYIFDINLYHTQIKINQDKFFIIDSFDIRDKLFVFEVLASKYVSHNISHKSSYQMLIY